MPRKEAEILQHAMQEEENESGAGGGENGLPPNADGNFGP